MNIEQPTPVRRIRRSLELVVYAERYRLIQFLIVHAVFAARENCVNGLRVSTSSLGLELLEVLDDAVSTANGIAERSQGRVCAEARLDHTVACPASSKHTMVHRFLYVPPT